MTISYKHLLDSMDAVNDLMARFKSISIERGGDGDSFDGIITTKLSLISNRGILGFIMWDANHPVGIAWVEKMTPTYGSILVYTVEKLYARDLVNYLLDSKLAVGVMSELLQFEDDQSIFDLFREKGILEIPRQRMVCHLPELSVYPEFPGNQFSLLPLSHMTSEWVSEVSVAAHQVSGDYRGYKDMETVGGRQKLERLVHDQFYGPVSQSASMALMHDGCIQSLILNVIIPCWGQPKMPWIFDIATSPNSMGKGYGEWLLKYAKAVLVDCGYAMWGLAVSQSNSGALRVYERNGFESVEFFSEFLQS